MPQNIAGNYRQDTHMVAFFDSHMEKGVDDAVYSFIYLFEGISPILKNKCDPIWIQLSIGYQYIFECFHV